MRGWPGNFPTAPHKGPSSQLLPAQKAPPFSAPRQAGQAAQQPRPAALPGHPQAGACTPRETPPRWPVRVRRGLQGWGFGDSPGWPPRLAFQPLLTALPMAGTGPGHPEQRDTQEGPSAVLGVLGLCHQAASSPLLSAPCLGPRSCRLAPNCLAAGPLPVSSSPLQFTLTPSSTHQPPCLAVQVTRGAGGGRGLGQPL